MILVQNRPLQLSGSKIIGLGLCCSLFLSSCGVFGPIFSKKKPRDTEQTVDPDPDQTEKDAPIVEPEKVEAMDVTLLLPLQLNQIQQNRPGIDDVKRTMLPLDFYQGFRLGMTALPEEGKQFTVHVLDSRDNEAYSRSLGQSKEAKAADLIVGPIFPKEISAFSEGLQRSEVLLVSPLAASTPSDFNVPNLVSLVPPITQHAKSMVAYLEDTYGTEDKIFLYRDQGSENDKFMEPVSTYLEESGLDVHVIDALDAMESLCTLSGRNVFIMGSTNRYAIMSTMSVLRSLEAFGYTLDVYGHPGWAKMNFDASLFEGLQAYITSSSYVDTRNPAVNVFRRNYVETFKVEPSEYAYKGYDAGYFFGYMLGKYGAEVQKALGKEDYKGLQTSYTFESDPKWGFVNTYIELLQFKGNAFQPLEK